MIDEESLFDKNYQKTRSFLKDKLRLKTSSLKEIEDELEALYRYEGLDWTGRGELKRIEIESSILAYEVFLLEYKRASSPVS